MDFTLKDISAMTGITTRTLRTYLAMDLLSGEKLNQEWRFTQEQSDDFLTEDIVSHTLMAKEMGMVMDFLNAKKKEARALIVVDFAADNDKENELRDRLVGICGGDSGLEMKYRYNGSTARFVVEGTTAAVADFAALAEA